MAVTISQFERALFEHLQAQGIQRVYSQAVPQEGVTPALVIRESGSTSVYDLEGAWEINTANYELACLAAHRDTAYPEVAVKELAQATIDALTPIEAKATFGTTQEVFMDSAILLGQTTRQFADNDQAGVVYLYSQRWQFNYSTIEVAA